MRRIIPWCVLMFFFWGCSSSDPSIIEVSASDSEPVTRQKVLFQVWGMSDNAPMRYFWEADSGELKDWNQYQPYVYWIAPGSAATSRITCTITDDEDNSSVHVFEVAVKERALEPLLNEGSVVSLEKQRVSLLGGVWVSTREGRIRYVSSSTNEDTTWTGTFGTMYINLYNDLYTSSYTLWGAPLSGNEISMQSSSGGVVLVCEECEADEAIHDLEIDVIDSNLLWIAADSGLHWYNSSSGKHGTYEEDAIRQPYALFPGTDFVYVASSSGIFTLDGQDDEIPLYPENSYAVLETIDDDADPVVWHISGNTVCKDGQALETQPPEGGVAYSLDIDLSGNIWCGKYRWDGSSWQQIKGLETVNVVKSVASNEGLVYFQTNSGALLRW